MALPLEVLLQLQQRDHQTDASRERLAQLPVELERVRQRVDAARQATAQAQQALDECQKRRRDKEQDVQAHEERLAKLKARLSEIKTNKEYQAHLVEIEAAKQAQRTAEDELLLFMEQAETLTQQIRQGEAQLTEATSRAAAEESALAQEGEQIRRELERLEVDVAQLEHAVEPALLKTYQQLRSRWKGMAVVPIQNGSCAGCRLAVPPQLITEVRRHESAQHCPHCGRFLYWLVV